MNSFSTHHGKRLITLIASLLVCLVLAVAGVLCVGAWENASADSAGEQAPCGHALGQTHVEQEATCVAPGVGTRYCAECRRSYSVVIPADGVSHSVGADGKHCAWCGEEVAYTVTPNEETNTAEIEGVEGAEVTEIVIPEKINERDVIVKENSFEGHETLQKVTIKGAPVIGAEAFKDCAALQTLIMEEGTETIGDGAFAGCTALKDVTLPDGLTSVGKDILADTAYYGAAENWDGGSLYNNGYLLKVSSLERAEEGAGVSRTAFVDLGDGEFSGVYAVDEGTTVIAAGAFEGLAALTHVKLVPAIVTVGEGAFAQTGLLSVLLPQYNAAMKDAFAGLNGVRLYYLGAESDAWLESALPLLGAEADVYYLCPELPASYGSFWRYDGSGNPAVWVNLVKESPLTFSGYKSHYLTNESLEEGLAGLAVTAHYEDGTEKVLQAEEYELDTSAVKIAEAGTYTVKVTHRYVEGTFEVEVGLHIFNVTIVYNNGADNGSDQVTEGKTYNLPQAPYYKGYTFDGWKVNGEIKQPAEEIEVTGDFTIEAQWTAKTPNVQVVLGEGGDGASASYGELQNGQYTVTVTGEPTRAGYRFDGWTVTLNGAEAALTDEGTLAVPLDDTMDVVITAKWVKQTTVTYVLGDHAAEGASVPADVGDENRTVTLPQAPEAAANWKFVGWSVNGETKQAAETVTASEDMTVEALWQEIVFTLTVNAAHADVTYLENMQKENYHTGDLVKFTVAPHAGYAVVSVSAEHAELSDAEGVYTLTIGTENAVLTVETVERHIDSVYNGDLYNGDWFGFWLNSVGFTKEDLDAHKEQVLLVVGEHEIALEMTEQSGDGKIRLVFRLTSLTQPAAAVELSVKIYGTTYALKVDGAAWNDKETANGVFYTIGGESGASATLTVTGVMKFTDFTYVTLEKEGEEKVLYVIKATVENYEEAQANTIVLFDGSLSFQIYQHSYDEGTKTLTMKFDLSQFADGTDLWSHLKINGVNHDGDLGNVLMTDEEIRSMETEIKLGERNYKLYNDGPIPKVQVTNEKDQGPTTTSVTLEEREDGVYLVIGGKYSSAFSQDLLSRFGWCVGQWQGGSGYPNDNGYLDTRDLQKYGKFEFNEGDKTWKYVVKLSGANELPANAYAIHFAFKGAASNNLTGFPALSQTLTGSDGRTYTLWPSETSDFWGCVGLTITGSDHVQVQGFGTVRLVLENGRAYYVLPTRIKNYTADDGWKDTLKLVGNGRKPQLPCAKIVEAGEFYELYFDMTDMAYGDLAAYGSGTYFFPKLMIGDELYTGAGIVDSNGDSNQNGDAVTTFDPSASSVQTSAWRYDLNALEGMSAVSMSPLDAFELQSLNHVKLVQEDGKIYYILTVTALNFNETEMKKGVIVGNGDKPTLVWEKYVSKGENQYDLYYDVTNVSLADLVNNSILYPHFMFDGVKWTKEGAGGNVSGDLIVSFDPSGELTQGGRKYWLNSDYGMPGLHVEAVENSVETTGVRLVDDGGVIYIEISGTYSGYTEAELNGFPHYFNWQSGTWKGGTNIDSSQNLAGTATFTFAGGTWTMRHSLADWQATDYILHFNLLSGSTADLKLDVAESAALTGADGRIYTLYSQGAMWGGCPTGLTIRDQAVKSISVSGASLEEEGGKMYLVFTASVTGYDEATLKTILLTNDKAPNDATLAETDKYSCVKVTMLENGVAKLYFDVTDSAGIGYTKLYWADNTAVINGGNAGPSGDGSQVDVKLGRKSYSVYWGNTYNGANLYGSVRLTVESLYSVTYDANAEGEEIQVPTDGTLYKEKATVTVSGDEVVRSGYTFLGWKVNGAGDLIEKGGTFTMPASDVVLKAEWEAIPENYYAVTGATLEADGDGAKAYFVISGTYAGYEDTAALIEILQGVKFGLTNAPEALGATETEWPTYTGFPVEVTAEGGAWKVRYEITVGLDNIQRDNAAYAWGKGARVVKYGSNGEGALLDFDLTAEQAADGTSITVGEYTYTLFNKNGQSQAAKDYYGHVGIQIKGNGEEFVNYEIEATTVRLEQEDDKVWYIVSVSTQNFDVESLKKTQIYHDGDVVVLKIVDGDSEIGKVVAVGDDGVYDLYFDVTEILENAQLKVLDDGTIRFQPHFRFTYPDNQVKTGNLTAEPVAEKSSVTVEPRTWKLVNATYFYAIDLTIEKVNVTIDDGHGGQTTQKAVKGEAYTLPQAPVYPNHEFTGWKVNGGDVKQPDDTVTFSEDFTIVAQWTAVYTVNYYLTADDTAPAHTDTVKGNSLTEVWGEAARNGFAFTAWTRDGKPVTVDSDTSYDLEANNDGTYVVNLVATWEFSSVTIGTPDNNLGYTANTPVFTETLHKGESITYKGTMTSSSTAPANHKTVLLYLYSESVWGQFRADWWINGLDIDENSTPKVLGAENWNILKNIGPNWTNYPTTILNADVTLTFDYTDGDIIVVTLTFVAKNNLVNGVQDVETMSFVIVPVSGHLKDSYTLGLGGEGSYTVLNERTVGAYADPVYDEPLKAGDKIGADNNATGYTPKIKTYKLTKGEKFELTGTMTSNASHNWEGPLVSIYRGSALDPLGAVFRADDAVLSDVRFMHAYGLNIQKSNSITKEDAETDPSIDGDIAFWASMRKTMQNCNVTISLDWTDVSKIVVTMQFVATGDYENTYTEIYTITPKDGLAFKDAYNFDLGVELCQITVGNAATESSNVNVDVKVVNPYGEKAGTYEILAGETSLNEGQNSVGKGQTVIVKVTLNKLYHVAVDLSGETLQGEDTDGVRVFTSVELTEDKTLTITFTAEQLETEQYEIYVDGHGNNKYYIFRRYTDTKGEAVELNETPAFSATVGGAAVDAEKLAVRFENGTYIFTIDMTGAAFPADIAYTVGEETGSVKLGAKQGDPHTTAETNRFYNAEGKQNSIGGGDHQKYYDIFAVDEISHWEDLKADKAIEFNGMPLFHGIEAEKIGSLDALTAYLKKQGVATGEFSFVMLYYQKWDDEQGAVHYTRIGSCVISEVMTLTIPAELVKATNESQVVFTAQNGYLGFLRAPSHGAAFTVYGAKYVELEITNKDGDVKSAYIFLETEDGKDNLYLYADTEKSGDKLKLNVLTDGNSTDGAFQPWVRNAFGWTEENFTLKDGVSKMRTRIITSEESVFFDGDWSEYVICNGWN